MPQVATRRKNIITHRHTPTNQEIKENKQRGKTSQERKGKERKRYSTWMIHNSESSWILAAPSVWDHEGRKRYLKPGSLQALCILPILHSCVTRATVGHWCQIHRENYRYNSPCVACVWTTPSPTTVFFPPFNGNKLHFSFNTSLWWIWITSTCAQANKHPRISNKNVNTQEMGTCIFVPGSVCSASHVPVTSPTSRKT